MAQPKNLKLTQGFGIILAEDVDLETLTVSAVAGTGSTVQPITGTTQLTNDDHGKTITNEGALGAPEDRIISLPAASPGLEFFFYDYSGLGMRIQAAAGDDIQIGAVKGIPGGYAQSVNIGSSVLLRAINNTNWIDVSTKPDWDVETP